MWGIFSLYSRVLDKIMQDADDKVVLRFMVKCSVYDVVMAAFGA